MKSFFVLICLVVSLGNALAAKLPQMIQIRAYNQDRNYVDEATGVPLSKSEVMNGYSTIYDFAHMVEIDARDNTIVKLFRQLPHERKTQVGAVNFLTPQQAQRFHNRLAAGHVVALAFPYPVASELYGDAAEVIARFR